MNFQQSKTYRNLRAAYEGELHATGKYRLYAERAADENQQNVAAVFAETAENEQEHADQFFQRLHAGDRPDTQADLRDAAAGEFAEWTEIYPRFAREAESEGYHEIARLFERVGAVERNHNQRFCRLADEQRDGARQDEEIAWICLNCGNVHIGCAPPQRCPLCGKPQGWYTRLCD